MVSIATPIISTAAPTTAAATTKWVAPIPLWNTAGTSLQQPFVAEFTEDSFMPDFLNMMAGNVAPDLPAPLNIGDQNNILYRLFQPLHQRYYLVTASLVCRKLGMPDRSVDRKNGEKVSFVLRRLVPQPPVSGQPQQYIELAWVEAGQNKGWQPLTDDQNNPIPLRKDEERLPLHPAKYCPFPASPAGTGSTVQPKPCETRTVHHGYIPVDKREKYLVPVQLTAIQANITSSGADPRLNQVSTEVIQTWLALYVDPITHEKLALDLDLLNLTGSPEEQTRKTNLRQQISLYLIVDLGDFLKTYLSSVFNAITRQSSIQDSDQQALFDELNNIMITVNARPTKLTDAIKQLQDKTNLSNAESDPPIDTYDVANATARGVSINAHYLSLTYPQPPGEGTLHPLFDHALRTSPTHFNIPADIARLVKDEPTQGDIFIARLVYERGTCDPIISNISPAFTFAKFFEPGAPARKIRIEMPSIRLKDLRQHQRGVAFQMPGNLNDLLNRINPGMLKGGGLADTGPPLDFAVICTFSIPIITICALIVMFIFLILLNIIFWWLPFIRICFPIPKK